MTLTLPDDSKRARIVLQLSGPVRRLQLRHVPSDWMIEAQGVGPDLDASAATLRSRALRQGYAVEAGYQVEDLRGASWGGRGEVRDLDDDEADSGG